MTTGQRDRTYQRDRRVVELPDTLVSLGQTREAADGRYVRT
jgi:hypothetical protein